MYFILFFFILFILLLFLALTVLGGVARFLSGLFSFFRPRGSARTGRGEQADTEVPQSGRHRQNGKKVFAADEGEYVDFVEIKDDAPERGMR